MKTGKIILITLLIFCFGTVGYSQVTYKLRYDFATSTYIVSLNSETAYSGPLARISASTLVTVVAPHNSGPFQVTNLINLQPGGTPLSWGFSRLDAPAENPSKDYLFFAPNNGGTYTPFNIAANTDMDLFSFQSGTGCEGTLALFENASDPLNANPTLNPKNNFVILAAGPGNNYVGNTSADVACCSAGAIGPPLAVSSIANSCPLTEVDLIAQHTGTIPTGAVLVWSEDNDETDGLSSTVTSPISVAGTYYAYYQDPIENCFSPSSNSITVTINSCVCLAGDTPPPLISN